MTAVDAGAEGLEAADAAGDAGCGFVVAPAADDAGCGDERLRPAAGPDRDSGGPALEDKLRERRLRDLLADVALAS